MGNNEKTIWINLGSCSWIRGSSWRRILSATIASGREEHCSPCNHRNQSVCALLESRCDRILSCPHLWRRLFQEFLPSWDQPPFRSAFPQHLQSKMCQIYNEPIGTSIQKGGCPKSMSKERSVRTIGKWSFHQRLVIDTTGSSLFKRGYRTAEKGRTH